MDGARPVCPRVPDFGTFCQAFSGLLFRPISRVHLRTSCDNLYSLSDPSADTIRGWIYDVPMPRP